MTGNYLEPAMGAAFNAGRLPAPLALLAEALSALNGQLDAYSALGGAFLEAEIPDPMRPDALELALKEIDALESNARLSSSFKTARAASAYLTELSVLPEPVRNACMDALERASWRFAGLGVRSLPLLQEGGFKAELLRIEPGRGAPRHGHRGQEYTLVLQGAFADGRARYGRGDLCECGPGDMHRPLAEPGEICYALAVTDGPLEFKNIFGVLQRMTRH